ncbi:MAG: ABC transporter substrate-binding protein [Deltaproteobacteria bacterium]|nr:ABC transporter substrate-binding protein [Deltaproteobacteria bacterium]
MWSMRWGILVLMGLGLIGQARADTTRMPVAYVAISGSSVPLWVAHEEGLFARHGLQVAPIYIAGGSRVVQALVGRSVEMAVTGGGVIEATLGGADVIFVAAHLNNPTFSLYARPEIRQVEELRGKVVGVTRLGTATMYGALLVLRKFGLEPGRDASVLQTGGHPETLAAMQAGTIHAGVIAAPTTLRARGMGFRELVDIAALGIPYIPAGVVASRAYLGAQPKRAEAFLKGFIEGVRLYKANRGAAEKALSKYTRVRDPEVLRETYETYARYMSAKPYTSREAIANMLRLIGEQDPRARRARPEEFYDDRVLRAIEASGFFGPSAS